MVKKGKGDSKQQEQESPGRVVLVPLLSKREAEALFVETLASNADSVILLVVIDTGAMPGQFGFAANDIAGGSQLMDGIKKVLVRKRKHCDDIIEWGNTATKIEHLAMLKNAGAVYLVEQDNQFYKKLLRELREKLGKIEVVQVKLPEPEKRR